MIGDNGLSLLTPCLATPCFNESNAQTLHGRCLIGKKHLKVYVHDPLSRTSSQYIVLGLLSLLSKICAYICPNISFFVFLMLLELLFALTSLDIEAAFLTSPEDKLFD